MNVKKKNIIIFSTIAIVSGIVFYAVSKKPKSDQSFKDDKDFNNLMDKINKAPK